MLLFLVALKAGTSPCTATNYQLSEFGTARTFNLDNGTFTGLADPACGDYQGQDFWVEFTGPNSGLVSILLSEGSITDAAFEVYLNACNGLASSAGCFSDRNCGALDMPGANLQVIPGATYHIRIFQEGGGGGTLDFEMSDLGGSNFALNGDAEEYDSGNPNETCFKLTDATMQELGCAWFDTPIDFASGFEINYSLYFGDRDEGADGIAFVFHRETNPSCNNSGGALGSTGFSEAFIVEFDTFNNGPGAFGGDIPQDHVAIRLDNGFLDFNLFGPVSLEQNGNIEDDTFHDVRLLWDPISNVFQVFFDGNLVISTNIALVVNLFGNGQPVFWGVTGSTGNSVNEQIFCFDGFRLENSGSVEVNMEETVCEGEFFFFGNQLIEFEGEYEQVFQAANGCDSTVTLNLIHASLDVTGVTEITLGCSDSAVSEMLEASVDSNVDPSGLSFEWDTDNGSFESGENTLTPIINSAGTYTLTVEIDEFGCEQEFVVEVTEAELPFVSAQGGFIGCEGDGDSTIIISCNFDGEYDVQWTTTSGNFIGPTDITSPEVDTAGTYTVTVTDPATGCSNTASVEVSPSGGIVEESLTSMFFCPGEEGPIFLDAELQGEVISFEWSPAAGLSDPFSLNPEVLDVTREQIFTLTVKTPVGQNLVQNGSFAFGDTLFTSDYTTGTSQAGNYAVLENPQDFLGVFSDCDDNSPTDSQMLVVDSDTQAGQNVWCQEVEIQEGSSYYFSAWATNLCSTCFTNIPLLSMTINGDAVNTPFLLDIPDCEWVQLNQEPNPNQCWTGVGTVAELCITNLETERSGNDFALDDIGFYIICGGGSGECGIFPQPENAVNIAPAEIACQPDGILDLSATPLGDNTTDVSWSWQSAGSDAMILGGSDTGSPMVQGEGDYIVTLVDNITGCETMDTISLEMGNTDFPPFTLFGNALTCEIPTATVGVSGLDDDNYSYDWSGDGGSAGTGSTISVSSSGIYEVLITDLANDCTESQSIVIDENAQVPVLSISPLPALNCNQVDQSLTLDVDVDFSNVIAFEWAAQGGAILSGGDTENPEIMGAGTYMVTITDLTNGCTNTESIVIEEDTAAPNVSASLPNTLNCDNPQTQISVDGTSLEYQWTPDPNIISALEGNSISVIDAGSYSVVVIDPITGCDTSLTVIVTADFAEPDVVAGLPQTFTCSDQSLTLGASSSDPRVSIEWQTAGGLIINGGNTFTPEIGGAGEYTIIVTGENGCTAEDSVIIQADDDLPFIAQVPNLVIDCINPTVVIDATNSSEGPEFSFEWRDQNGDVISGFNSLSPTATSAGQFQLTIVNTANGCEAETIVNVENNMVDPDGVPTSVSPINCIDLNSTFGLETTNPDWSFTWSDATGVLSNENDFQLAASEEGTYNLIVTDQVNGCTSEYNFTLDSDTSEPQLSFNGNTVLSCDLTELQIGLTTDAANPSFSWQSEDGNIISATDVSDIQVDMSGTYTVTITDGITGCTVEDALQITNDENVPVILIPTVDNLTCDIEEILLIANVSNVGSDVEFIWSTTDGILASPNGESNITAGAPGTYVLTVVNQENGCEASSNIVVEQSFNTFVIEIDTPDLLDCDITEIVLNAEDVGTSNVIYLWTTADGSILAGADGPNPTVSQEGEYTLTVTDIETGCESFSSIFVEQDGDLPNIDIVPVDMLNCETTQLTIDASGSTQGLEILTEWSTVDGNIISGENTLMPVVDMAGEYLLTITNVANNCEVTQLVNLESNQMTPEVDFGSLDDINCGLSSVNINAAETNGVTNLEYEWTTLDGSIVGGANTSEIEVDAAGTYVLLITNLDNMCSETFSVDIAANMEVPDVSLGMSNILDCENLTSTLTVDFPTDNPNLIFEWTSIDGTIDGDPSSPEIVATAEGSYTVLVTDTQSNCETNLSVIIASNIEIPELDFIAPAVITCDNTQSVINTQTGLNGLLYEWSSTDGTILSAVNGEDVVVGSAGIYNLIVTNPANNCTNMIQVEVLEDIDLPTVEIEPALEQNCLVEEQSLSGDGSSMGDEFTYAWSTSMGSIVSGDNTLNPLITGSGFYILEITNNENNCVQTDSVLVTENSVLPLASIMPPAMIDCVNETVTLSTDISASADLIFEWSTDNGSIISDPNLDEIQVNGAGVYQLSILDNLNGCDNILSVEVFSNQEEPALDLAPGFTLTCDQVDGDLSIVEVSPDVDITWIDPQGIAISNTNSVTATEPGTYTAIAISSINGCATNRQVEVLLNDNMPTDLIADVFPPACVGDTGSVLFAEVIGGEGPYLYSTDDGQTFGDINGLDGLLPGTTNTVLVMDANGCELPMVFVIPNVVPVSVNLPVGADLLLGESLQLDVQTNLSENEISQIIWTPSAGLSCMDCLNPTVSPTSNIEYQVEIINLNGCSAIANIVLRVDTEQGVYIPNAFSPFNQDGFNDAFYLFSKPGVLTQVLSLQIYDRWGNQVFLNENFNPNEELSGWNGRFRDEKVQLGVYVYYALVEYTDGTTELFKGDVTLID